MKFLRATSSASGRKFQGRAQIPNLRYRRSCAAFTLAEVLAALVFMAIVIPVALNGLSIASRAGEVAARKRDAALVAERIINENIVTTNWDKTVQNGQIRQGLMDYRWTLRNEPWNEDANVNDMRLLSVEVVFSAQGRDYGTRLSTLVANTSSFGQTNSATP
jgi:type II secretory pathway pseudopilin PulG